MHAAYRPEWRISYSSHKPACVLDSALACSRYGLTVVKQLGHWAELWVVRDLWHLFEPGPVRRLLPCGQPLIDPRTLREWERLRQHVEPSQRPVHVLADALGESTLPAGCDPDLLWRWEQLARDLDDRSGGSLQPASEQDSPTRDLLALAAARGAAVLTLGPSAATGEPPALCRALKARDIDCAKLPPADPLSHFEAQALRGLIVHANLSPLVWSGMNLCVVRLFVPHAATLSPPQPWDDYAPALEEERLDRQPERDSLWDGARAFWFELLETPWPTEN
ncbi:MAG: hypothetical protein ACKO3F_15370 [Cyanobium sp.]